MFDVHLEANQRISECDGEVGVQVITSPLKTGVSAEYVKMNTLVMKIKYSTVKSARLLSQHF